jgi:hypothetical protein
VYNKYFPRTIWTVSGLLNTGYLEQNIVGNDLQLIERHRTSLKGQQIEIADLSRGIHSLALAQPLLSGDRQGNSLAGLRSLAAMLPHERDLYERKPWRADHANTNTRNEYQCRDATNL